MEIELVATPNSHGLRSKVIPTQKLDFLRLWELFRKIRTPSHEPQTLPTQQSELQPQFSTSNSSEGTSQERESVSVGSHLGVEVPGKFYVRPTMKVGEEHLQTWHSHIKERLENEIPQRLRQERCTKLDFWMVSDHKGRTKPCIILTCWDEANCQDESRREKTRKRVQKKLKRFQALKNCSYPCIVVIDTINLLANLAEEIYASSMAVTAEIYRDKETFAGLVIKGSGPPYSVCTLGGLITIGGRLYGLTVAHSFEVGSREVDVDYTHEAVKCDYLDESDCSSVKTSSSLQSFPSDNTENFSFYGSPLRTNHEYEGIQPEREITKVNGRIKTLGLDNVVPTNSTSQPLESESASPESFGRVIATSATKSIIGVSGSHKYDWALVDIDAMHETCCNSYVDPTSNARIFLRGIKKIGLGSSLEVTVVAGRSGSMFGTLVQQKSSISLGGRELNVLQVFLDRPLVNGDSGSWVTDGDSVIGCIVAGLKILPIAYMIPICDILQNIEASVKLGPVAIATQGDVEGSKSRIPTECQTRVPTSLKTSGATVILSELPSPTRFSSDSQILGTRAELSLPAGSERESNDHWQELSFPHTPLLTADDHDVGADVESGLGSSLGHDHGFWQDSVNNKAADKSDLVGSRIKTSKPKKKTEVSSGAAQDQPAITTHSQLRSQILASRKIRSMIVALSIVLFSVELADNIVPIAIPAISNEFGSLTHSTWYVCSFKLAASTTYPMTRKFVFDEAADLAYILAFLTFEAGIVISGLASTSNIFIAGRAISGAGSAGIYALSPAILKRWFPEQVFEHYLVILNILQIIARLLAPLLGGGANRILMAILPSLGLIAFLIFAFHLSSNLKKSASKIWTNSRLSDYCTPLFYVIPILLYTLPLEWAGSVYIWTDWRIILCWLLLLIILFYWFSLIAAFFLATSAMSWTPSLKKGNRHHGIRLPLSCVWNILLYGVFETFILWAQVWFQGVREMSPLESGIMVLPTIAMSVILGACGIKGGSAIRRLLAGILPYSAMIAGVGAGLLTTWEPDSNLGKSIGYQLIFGFGVGLGYRRFYLTRYVNSRVSRSVHDDYLMILQCQDLGATLTLPIIQNFFNNRLKILLQIATGDEGIQLTHSGVSMSANEIPALASNKLRSELPSILSKSIVSSWYLVVAMSILAFISALLGLYP